MHFDTPYKKQKNKSPENGDFLGCPMNYTIIITRKSRAYFHTFCPKAYIRRYTAKYTEIIRNIYLHIFDFMIIHKFFIEHFSYNERCGYYYLILA